MTNPDEVKDKFYDDLDSVISATTRTDKLILLGDLNARLGTDHKTWERVLSLFVPHFPIFGASGSLCFVIVAFPRYLYLLYL